MSQMIMRKDGTPFATEAAAKRARTELENPEKAKIIVIGDKQYAVEYDGEDSNIKKKRVPLRRRNVLTIEDKYKREDFEYRFVNDREDRIEVFEEAGWEKVMDEDQVIEIGDDSIRREVRDGTAVTKNVGGGRVAYLMKIPKDIYDEEQAIKQREIEQSEEAMRQTALNEKGRYGKVNFGSG
jgi:hypothetical protein